MNTSKTDDSDSDDEYDIFPPIPAEYSVESTPQKPMIKAVKSGVADAAHKGAIAKDRATRVLQKQAMATAGTARSSLQKLIASLTPRIRQVRARFRLAVWKWLKPLRLRMRVYFRLLKIRCRRLALNDPLLFFVSAGLIGLCAALGMVILVEILRS